MIHPSPETLRPHLSRATASLPPPAIDETAWDILLALHGHEPCALDLDKLGCLTSAQKPNLFRWLALLEQGHLITAAVHEKTREVRPALTADGRALLDGYLSAAVGLQRAAHQ